MICNINKQQIKFKLKIKLKKNIYKKKYKNLRLLYAFSKIFNKLIIKFH